MLHFTGLDDGDEEPEEQCFARPLVGELEGEQSIADFGLDIDSLRPLRRGIFDWSMATILIFSPRLLLVAADIVTVVRMVSIALQFYNLVLRFYSLF